MSDDYEKILNHLLFHKALEEDDTGKIDGYMELLTRVQGGYTFPPEARFESGIAALFDLVIEHSFNPWDIDLVRFSKAYLQRLRRLGTVDFISAGRLVLLAWSVLKLQSEVILDGAAPVNPPVEEFLDSWDITPGIYQNPDDVDFTRQLLSNEVPPLREALQREVVRPVTLLDLLDAFTEALTEAPGAAVAPKPPRRARMEAIREKVHREDLEDDIEKTWSAIREVRQDVVGFSQLCNGDRWERATFFLSILFLAKLGWLEIWQEDFPWGEVYLRPLKEGEISELVATPVATEVA